MYMPTKKKQCLKKTYKLKRRRNSSRYFKGGTCSACGSCMQLSPAIFSGGKNSYKYRSGGNDEFPSYNGLPLRYVYSQNTYNQDPSAPSSVVSSRLSNNSGGTRRRNRLPKKGGSMAFSYLNGQMSSSNGFNPVSIIGQTSGSTIHSNILSGDVSTTSLQNPSVFSQPVDTRYNIYNRPLA